MAERLSPTSPSADHPRHRLRTLGTSVLERQTDDGSWVPVLRSGKALALAVYLSAQEARTVSRETLADLLWGEEPTAKARGSLRQAIYSLRQLLGEHCLIADRDSIRLDVDRLTVDRNELLLACRDGNLAQIVSNYEGHFCPGLDAVGDAFERWVALERERIRRLVAGQALRELPRLVAAGLVGDAIRYAHHLALLEPLDPHFALAEFDALVAAGRLSEATERLESHRLSVEALGDAVHQGVIDRIVRAERAFATHTGIGARGLHSLGLVLIGREPIVVQLLQDAEIARGANTRRVVLVGPPGIGKTRLVDELDSRMRLRGARVIRVRFLPAMRTVPSAAAAEVIRGLVALPGAAGVSESAARTLVAQMPELAGRYPAAAAKGVHIPTAEECEAAYADLLSAVAEDRLVLLLLDDLQYADDESRRLLLGRMRPESLKLLELFSVRSDFPVDRMLADAVRQVAGLSVDDVRALLQTVAPFSAAEWVDPFLQELTSRCRGFPQQILQTVRAAHSTGVLDIHNGEWRATDPALLIRLVAGELPGASMVQDLGVLEISVLRLLSRWGRLLDERDLTGILQRAGRADGPQAVRSALRQIEERGLVQSRENSWALAHDSVSEALEFLPARGDEGVPLATLVAYWFGNERLTIGVIEHLAFVCGGAGDFEAAARLVRGASKTAAMREAGLQGRRLTGFIARSAGKSEWEQELFSRLEIVDRLGKAQLGFVSATAALGLVLIGWFLLMLQPRLVVEAEALGEIGVALERGSTAYELAVQPRVGLVNGFGKRLEMNATVMARLPRGTVRGDSVKSLSSGQVQFTRLLLEIPDSARDAYPIVLQFVGPWYARSTSVAVRGAERLGGSDAFSLVSAEIDGTPVPASRIVRNPSGDSMRVDLTFEYTTTAATANYVVGAAPTWGSARESVVRLAGLPSPVRGGWRSVSFKVPSPREIGSHHLIVLFGAEGGVDYLFSSTNWTVGLPVWDDGNDVIDLEPARLEELRRTGRLHVPRYLDRGYQGLQAPISVGDDLLARRLGPATRPLQSWEGAAIRIDVTDSALWLRDRGRTGG